MKIKRWRYIPLLIFFIMAVFLYRGLYLNPRLLPSALLDKPAPSSMLVKSMYGKVWLLNVWASWCLACREEHPVIMDMARSKVNIIGLDYRDSKSAANRWLAQYGSPYQRVIYDERGETAIDWGVYGAPETFIIDKSGVIRYKHVGVLTNKVWREEINPLLKQLQK